MKKPPSPPAPSFRIFEAASVLLFFFQALRVIISVMFGVVYDEVFAGSPGPWLVVSNLLLVAALLAPALLPRRPQSSWLAGAAVAAALARMTFSLNDPLPRFWGALVVIAAAGIYLAALLRFERRALATGLVTALILDQLIRILGDTYDYGLRPHWWLIQFPWSMNLVNLSLRLGRSARDLQPSGGVGWGWGAAFGGYLFLEASLLGLPNAVAGWSGIPYWIAALGLLALTLLFWDPALQGRITAFFTAAAPSLRLAAALLLPAGVLAGYFLSGPLAGAALFLARVLALLLALRLFLPEEGAEAARGERSGPALALGLLLFLLLVYFNAFAFTYPYALPFMRGLGWAVFLAGALAAASGFLQPWRPGPAAQDLSLAPILRLVAGVAVLFFAAMLVFPSPSQMEDDGNIRIATYNIHYGYNENWGYSLDEIARTIAQEGADIAMLQEVDTGRLTSYGVDNAYYLARKLGMNVYYLPTVEHLTGIAVLYRGEASELEARLLPSLQEQTGIIRVTLENGGGPLHAFGIWMGLSNEDTQTQIREALRFIGDRSPAAFGGDFNAQPGSPVVQAIVEAGFQDPFLALGMVPPPPTDPATEPRKQIDYVWLRGVEPEGAWVSESLASDHRLVVVELKP